VRLPRINQTNKLSNTMATITCSGVIIPVSYVVTRLTRTGYVEYLDGLTINFTPKIGAPRTTLMYKHVRNSQGVPCLLIPRGDLDVYGFESVSTMSTPRMALNMPSFTGTLRPSQKVVVDWILGRFTENAVSCGRACAYLELKAGFGKTFVAMAVASALGMRTAYVVPRRKLATQGLADASRVLSDNPPAVGTQQGKFSKKISSVPDDQQAITFFVVNSFLRLKPEELRKFSLIILDEVHMYHSAARRELFKKCRHAVIGMSATPEARDDGADRVVIRELGPVVHALQIPGFAYEAESSFRGRVRVIKYHGPSEYTQNLTHESTDRMFVHYMYQQFAEDVARTRVLVEEIKELLDWRGEAGQQHCIFVFGEEKNNLEVVRTALLTDSADIYASELAPEILDEDAAGMFVGGTSDALINAMTERCRVFFATYPFAGTGVSIPRATAAVFITPRKANMDQIVGRITRTGGDTSIERVVVDLVDTCTGLVGQYHVRASTYREYGFKQYHIHRFADKPPRDAPKKRKKSAGNDEDPVRCFAGDED
jgi:superfamily II DNA or RNA helicase